MWATESRTFTTFRIRRRTSSCRIISWISESITVTDTPSRSPGTTPCRFSTGLSAFEEWQRDLLPSRWQRHPGAAHRPDVVDVDWRGSWHFLHPRFRRSDLHRFRECRVRGADLAASESRNRCQLRARSERLLVRKRHLDHQERIGQTDPCPQSAPRAVRAGSRTISTTCPSGFFTTIDFLQHQNRRSASVGLTFWMPLINQRTARQ